MIISIQGYCPENDGKITTGKKKERKYIRFHHLPLTIILRGEFDMKNNDYSNLIEEYPAIISLEQFSKIGKISKRKATWLLEKGIVPCTDSGKKTHRFKISICDVIDCLIKMDNGLIIFPYGACWQITQNKRGFERKSNPLWYFWYNL